MGAGATKAMVDGATNDTGPSPSFQQSKQSSSHDDDLCLGSDIHHSVTAAIDFGTTSSGFAFVFEDKPNDIQVNKWILGSSEKEKAPTTVLLKKDKSFHSFGYKAENDYARLCESGDQKGWRYFHFFKMELYRKEVAIPDDQLRLVLEPEAASVYCSGQTVVRRGGGSGGDQFQPLSVGQTYILGDIGGGTLDLATHKIISEKCLHEQYVVRGNDMGGHYFNKKFLEFLEELFGPDCFKKWKTTECGDFLDLERDIEDIKRKVGDENEGNVKLNIRLSLLALHRESTGCTDIEVFGTKKEFATAIDSVNSRNGYIMLKRSFLREFIEQSAVAIKKYIATIVEDDPSVKLIFLVGGLAKSALVRQYIESRFSNCKVIVPEDPGVAVLKGAVLLGNRPQTIASRIARYSYGISGATNFIHGHHKQEHKFCRDGSVLCRNLFVKLIEKGQVLRFGQKFTTTSRVEALLPVTKQDIFTTDIFQSIQESPMYTTETGCSLVGGFEKRPPKDGWPDTCQHTIELMVGEAEFKVQVSDELGRNYETQIDFLLPDE